MEKTMKILDFIQNNKVKRIVIPDNEYLPFLDITEMLMDMEVGNILAFPLKKGASAKVMVKRIENTSDREYRCARNDKEKTYDVCRFL